MSDEKACAHCKYFIQYYVITNYRLRKAGNGHCGNVCKNGRLRSIDKPCGEWTEKDAEREEKSFRKILEKIAKSLEDLALIIDKEK